MFQKNHPWVCGFNALTKILRHFLTITYLIAMFVAVPSLLFWRWWYWPNRNVVDIESSNDVSFESINMTEAFTKVYNENIWGSEGKGSGPGSAMKNTNSIRKFVSDFITEKKIKSLLDSPCGAMEWQPELLAIVGKNVQNFKYKGVDIVKHLIEQHKAEFSNHSNWEFAVGDITSDPPDQSYDLVLVRDVYFHLTNDKIKKSLELISKSGSKWLMTNTFPGVRNVNAAVWGPPLNQGGYRKIDLMQPPFNLPAPKHVCKEPENKRILGIWELPLQLT